MIDRIIKLLVLCLGGLFIFLVGHLLFSNSGEQGRPPAASSARTEPAPDQGDAGDVATKRVKTIPVRPGEPVVAPQKP